MGDISEYMKIFVLDLVKKIVDKPESVKVDVFITTKTILVQVSAEKSELGKIIGKSGRSIEALKVITTVVKNTQFLGDKKVVSIEIIE